MRRSLWLVAASWWLLPLGACGDQPAAKAPRSRPPHTPSAAHVAWNDTGRAADEDEQRPESTANSGTSTAYARAPRAHDVPEPTSEQLAERFGRARALSIQSGSGSYYADKFAGRSTASGAPYEPHGFTAAHRTLPFGTVLRVTRKDGGQVVYVRVTDRGPYGPRGRILDLSRAAAEKLGMLRAGVVKIKVEVLEYGPRKQRRRRR